MNENKTEFEPNIVAFVCNWCTYAGADLTGTSRLKYATNVKIVRFPCTGRIDFMLLLKAFAGGADGIIVSGCHPNDCHYTSGNFHARRRWIVFRGLLDFMGIDVRRIRYSWVSAAEGGKWADLVNDTVREIRELGPYTRYREVADYIERRKTMDKLTEKAAALLREGAATLVIGYGEDKGNKTRPLFCRIPEEAARLVYDGRCIHNLAVYLTKPELLGAGRTAVVATIPVLRSILQLAAENQLSEDKLLVLTVADGEVMQFDTFAAVESYLTGFDFKLGEKERELIGRLEGMSREERWEFWKEQLEPCFKCYACRAACPLCYCTRCVVEINCPQWVQPWAGTLPNIEWHINRAMHMAGRCTGCGACGEACPLGIPIHLLTQKLLEDVDAEFGAKSGTLGQKGNALSTFDPSDKENFIR